MHWVVKTINTETSSILKYTFYCIFTGFVCLYVLQCIVDSEYPTLPCKKYLYYQWPLSKH